MFFRRAPSVPSRIAIEGGDAARFDFDVPAVDLVAKVLELALDRVVGDVRIPGFGTTIVAVAPAVAAPLEDCALAVRSTGRPQAPPRPPRRLEKRAERPASAARQGPA